MAVSNRRFEGRRYLVFPLHEKRSVGYQPIEKRIVLSIGLSVSQLLEYFVLHDEADVCIFFAFSNLSFILQIDVPTFLLQINRWL
jgi:hypothetical protein